MKEYRLKIENQNVKYIARMNRPISPSFPIKTGIVFLTRNFDGLQGGRMGMSWNGNQNGCYQP